MCLFDVVTPTPENTQPPGVFARVCVIFHSYMYLLVQSAERSPSYLTQQSLEFVKEFREKLADMPAAKLR